MKSDGGRETGERELEGEKCTGEEGGEAECKAAGPEGGSANDGDEEEEDDDDDGEDEREGEEEEDGRGNDDDDGEDDEEEEEDEDEEGGFPRGGGRGGGLLWVFPTMPTICPYFSSPFSPSKGGIQTLEAPPVFARLGSRG